MSVISTQSFIEQLYDASMNIHKSIEDYKEQYEFSKTTASPNRVKKQIQTIIHNLNKQMEESKKNMTQRIQKDSNHWKTYVSSLDTIPDDTTILLPHQRYTISGSNQREKDYKFIKQRHIWNIIYVLIGGGLVGYTYWKFHS